VDDKPLEIDSLGTVLQASVIWILITGPHLPTILGVSRSCFSFG